MDMPAIISHGDTAPLLTERRITRRLDGLDTGVIRYTTTDPDAFSEGQSLPDAPGLIIQQAELDQDGLDFDFTLSVLGVDGVKPARRLKGFPDRRYNLLDFDRVEDAWLTSNPSLIQEGQTGNFGGTTVCLSASDKLIHPGWYEVRGSFIGILRNRKDRKRVIRSNGFTVSGDTITVNLPGGWTTPRKGQAQLPQVVVEDTYIGFNPPPTHLIPGPATPPNAPNVKVITVTGDDVTSYWPAGWYLSSVGGNQIGERGLWESTWIYTYQMPYTF